MKFSMTEQEKGDILIQNRGDLMGKVDCIGEYDNKSTSFFV